MNRFWRNFKRNTLKISAVIILAFLIIQALEIRKLSDDEGVRINEICSENLSSLYDENGNHPDWIELYNSSDEAVDISGWYLSDSEKHLDKWSFPEGTSISANGFLLVYADSTEEAQADTDESLSLSDFIMTGRAIAIPDNGMHCSFSLSGKGENLYLSDKRLTVCDSAEIPALKYDSSWARESDGDGEFSRRTVSPGRSNIESAEMIYPTIDAPEFSAESGFYDDEFRLELSAQKGTVIRYTLDGSIPDENSTEYTEPIEIKDRSGDDNLYSALREVSVELLSYINYKYRIPDSPVDKCNVVRAAAFTSDGEVSETVTKVYFVGYDKKDDYNGIGVISIVSDPEVKKR